MQKKSENDSVRVKMLVKGVENAEITYLIVFKTRIRKCRLRILVIESVGFKKTAIVTKCIGYEFYSDSFSKIFVGFPKSLEPENIKLLLNFEVKNLLAKFNT